MCADFKLHSFLAQEVEHTGQMWLETSGWDALLRSAAVTICIVAGTPSTSVSQCRCHGFLYPCWGRDTCLDAACLYARSASKQPEVGRAQFLARAQAGESQPSKKRAGCLRPAADRKLPRPCAGPVFGIPVG